MLRDGSDNWNVFLSVGRIKEGHASSTPFGFTSEGEEEESEDEDADDTGDEESDEEVETGFGNVLSNPVNGHESLDEEEDTMRSEMLRAVECLESNEWNLHGQESTHNVEDTVRDVNLAIESSDNEQEDDEDWDNVDDERVATPS
jgi:hypothetical protein